MLDFPRWKVWSITLVILIGILCRDVHLFHASDCHDLVLIHIGLLEVLAGEHFANLCHV